jgi:outer membrane receptor protein involved in Fe transport
MPTGPELSNPVTGALTGQAPFAASYSNPSSLDATSLRIDHSVNDRVLFFGRYNYAPSEQLSRRISQLTTTAFTTQTATLGATLLLSSRLTNELLANYSHNRGLSNFFTDTLGGAIPVADSVLIPSFASAARSNATIIFNGVGFHFFQAGSFNDNVQRQLNLIDNLSYIVGAHQLKFGFDYRRLAPIRNPRDYTQQLFFNNRAAIAAGTVSLGFILAIQSTRPVFANYSAYAQDTWKLTPQLTLTYGLRYEVNPPPHETDGHDPFTVTAIDDPLTLTLAPRGTPLYRTTYNNFAPRVGLAYQLSREAGKERVLRGGFGVFYDLGSGQTAEAFTSSPFITPFKSISNVPYPLTPVQAAPPPFSLNPPFNITAFDPALKLPYTWQWNLALEQSLGNSQTLSASYVAAVGRRLLRTVAIPDPNANFGEVTITSNGATSDYHSLQLQFQRRLTRGLQALASYTWAHALDEVSVEGSATDQLRGNADFDLRHSFSGAITYNLPAVSAGKVGRPLLRHWSLDAIVHAQSAQPLSVIAEDSVTLAGTRIVIRPNLVLGAPLYIEDTLVAGGQRINRNAFQPPPAGQQGNLGRNTLRGFPLYQVDLALRRQFNLTERLAVEFRAEAFNLFNHPNFANPINGLSSGQFGQSTQMLGRSLGGLSPLYQIGGPRSLQFALRLQF